MTIAFTWAFIATLVSIALTSVLSSLFHKEDNRYSRRRTGNYLTWVGVSLLLVFLPACSGLISSNEDVQPTITPLTLTVTSQSTAKSTTPTTSSTDWTTYH